MCYILIPLSSLKFGQGTAFPDALSALMKCSSSGGLSNLSATSSTHCLISGVVGALSTGSCIALIEFWGMV